MSRVTSEEDIVEGIREMLAHDPEAFEAAVEEELSVLRDEIRKGTFDNPQAIVGMEQELYGVDEETCRLRRIPRRLLSYLGCVKELGLHQAELNTSPQPLNQYGLRTQEQELRARLLAAQTATRWDSIRLVSDGMWTIPPDGETASEYLDESVEADGVRIATNMSESLRYHAMSNAEHTGYEPRMEIDAPHVSYRTDTVFPESLICSVQPHYQAPAASDLPVYHGYALRVAGPLLALAVNSPFFPPDMYDAGADAEAVLADAHMEHRIGVFESALNPVEGEDKVRFPADVATLEDAIERVAADKTIVPRGDLGGGDRFDDRWAHFRHKHGTYWRWVRPVFEGASRKAANARVEFRPIPAQPTVRDGVAFLAAFAGLMEALPRREHPLEVMPWEQARDNFYAAARDGLAAEMTWITADGEETTDHGEIYAELFDYARLGLEDRGVDADHVASYLRPLEARSETRTTPARWKHRRVRERVDDGADLESAVYRMQREYVARQRETLIEGDFSSWIERRGELR